MKPLLAVFAALGAMATNGCVAPVGPVEVTRFHVPELAAIGRGAIAIEPAAGQDGSSLEFSSYAGAVSRQLGLLGYSPTSRAGPSPQLAVVRIERHSWRPDRARGPVSVGVGGGTGSYGSGVGVGIGFDLSGPPPEQVETQLSVTIKDRASGKALWEGKAYFAVRASSPLATTQLGAAKLAEALFKGFPGSSGETIRVQ
ncbi:MAG: DUF4136 domain-containing protein [Novosphingobium sp.]